MRNRPMTARRTEILLTRRALRQAIAAPDPGSRRLLMRATIALAVLVLIGGSLGVWWSVGLADREMKDGLLLETRLLAQSLNVERVAVLTGDLEDLEKPQYPRLKSQLATVARTDPRYRFVYLMGVVRMGSCSSSSTMSHPNPRTTRRPAISRTRHRRASGVSSPPATSMWKGRSSTVGEPGSRHRSPSSSRVRPSEAVHSRPMPARWFKTLQPMRTCMAGRLCCRPCTSRTAPFIGAISTPLPTTST